MFELKAIQTITSYVGEEVLYDLTVAIDETYVANNMCVHNTDLCRSLDGKIYRKEDPIWNSITPPLHFNCRSLLIPIMTFDVEDDKIVPSEPVKIDELKTLTRSNFL